MSTRAAAAAVRMGVLALGLVGGERVYEGLEARNHG